VLHDDLSSMIMMSQTEFAFPAFLRSLLFCVRPRTLLRPSRGTRHREKPAKRRGGFIGQRVLSPEPSRSAYDQSGDPVTVNAALKAARHRSTRHVGQSSYWQEVPCPNRPPSLDVIGRVALRRCGARCVARKTRPSRREELPRGIALPREQTHGRSSRRVRKGQARG
jgi:hypothetical protein